MTRKCLRTHPAGMFVSFLPVHDYPMWNVNTLYVSVVVFWVGEEVQTVTLPVILYLGQTTNS